MNFVDKIKRKTQKHPSLYDVFELGDRVKRIYRDVDGSRIEFKGIVLAIDSSSMEIYWDTQDGKYRPDNMNIEFTNCQVNEIFTGTKEYTPIKKDNRYN